MTNGEKYEKEIVEFCKDAKRPVINNNFCKEFISPKILQPLGLKCGDGISNFCDACIMLQSIWLNKEYEEPKEPEVDWSNVAVDTQILVSGNSILWYKRYFAKYEKGMCYAWDGGGTSWNTTGVKGWRYAKLAEEEK